MIPRAKRKKEYGLKHMLKHWDAIAKVIILFLILSTPLVLLAYNDTVTHKSSSFTHIAQEDQDGAGIALTFNGWSVDNWYTIRNLLNTSGANVTFFVGNFDFLTEDHYNKLRALKSDGHEIAAQGYDYYDAVDYVTNYSLQAYIDNEITPTIELMSEKELTPTSFAYPFGSRNSMLDTELLKHFSRLRATAYTSNDTRIDDLDMAYYGWQNETLVRGVGVDYEYENSIEEIIEGMDRAVQENEVLILYAHTITYDATPYGVPEAKLIAILEAAQARNLPFYTITGLSDMIIRTTPTTTENGGGNPWGLNDFVISIVIACVGIGFLWIFVTVVFRDEHKWQSS
jgi:peptidoglycan/xylan/chitin deacetylase (PgdA/CDA1 family)